MIKNMNNKGFAISTLLYGLLVVIMLILTLIIGTMAYNRSSTKSFVSEIIADLEEKHSNTSPLISTESNSDDTTPATPTIPTSDDKNPPTFSASVSSMSSVYNKYLTVFKLSISDDSKIVFNNASGDVYFNVIKYPAVPVDDIKLKSGVVIGGCNSNYTECTITVSEFTLPNQECGGLYACNLQFDIPASAFCDEYNNCNERQRVHLYNFS